MTQNQEPAARPGLRTTEFWLVMLTNLMVPVMAHFEHVPGLIGVSIMAILNAVYVILRSAIKNNLANK